MLVELKAHEKNYKLRMIAMRDFTFDFFDSTRESRTCLLSWSSPLAKELGAGISFLYGEIDFRIAF